MVPHSVQRPWPAQHVLPAVLALTDDEWGDCDRERMCGQRSHLLQQWTWSFFVGCSRSGGLRRQSRTLT
jgi:hypothetical protein